MVPSAPPFVSYAITTVSLSSVHISPVPVRGLHLYELRRLPDRAPCPLLLGFGSVWAEMAGFQPSVKVVWPWSFPENMSCSPAVSHSAKPCSGLCSRGQRLGW